MSKRHDNLKERSLRKKDEKRVHKGSEKAIFHNRSKNVSKIIKMYSAKPKFNAETSKPAEPTVRIEPGRKWFSNTRVVDQNALEEYRETLSNASKNPRKIVFKRTKLPLSLFTHDNSLSAKKSKNLLSVQPFSEITRNKYNRNNHTTSYRTLEDLAALSVSKTESYENQKFDKDSDLIINRNLDEKFGQIDAVMLKGTSKRIWGELYKVVDSSDIILQVLDVRDPLGTRFNYLEEHIIKDRPFKHIILILNKCDLVPEWVTDKWVKKLSAEFPTVPFKASIKHPFGKRSLINLLRQYVRILKNRKHVSVGVIGFPNVGKSSLINTLKGEKVCTSAPIPGETKVWQYIDLTNKVYLIDCPGIVIGSKKNDTSTFVDKVIKGVVRPEKISEPESYINSIIEIVGKKKFYEIYDIDENLIEDEEILDYLAKKWGKLSKGGQSRLDTVAVKIIQDLQRGKLPYFLMPMLEENDAGKTKNVNLNASNNGSP